MKVATTFLCKVMEEAVMVKRTLKKKEAVKKKTMDSASGRVYGYIRVSTLQQNDDRQRAALTENK